MIAGYSNRPLCAKLGIKSGHRVLFDGAPTGYRQTLGPLPPRAVARTTAQPGENFAVIQTFVRSRRVLEATIRRAQQWLANDGALWVCWKKQSSAEPADFNENDVRAAGLAAGLVDVKICAVDQTWSGLKFVYPLAKR